MTASGNVTCFLEAMGDVHEELALRPDIDLSDDIQTSLSSSDPELVQLSTFQENVTAYIAGYTVRKIRSKAYVSKCT